MPSADLTARKVKEEVAESGAVEQHLLGLYVHKAMRQIQVTSKRNPVKSFPSHHEDTEKSNVGCIDEY